MSALFTIQANGGLIFFELFPAQTLIIRSTNDIDRLRQMGARYPMNMQIFVTVNQSYFENMIKTRVFDP